MITDFMQARISIQEIDRELEQKRLQKFDPDGLAQYEVWDNMFAGPSLFTRIKSLAGKFRRDSRAEVGEVSLHRSTECLPQG